MNIKNTNKYMSFAYDDFMSGKVTCLNTIKWDEKNNLLKGELVILYDPTGENDYAKIGFKLEGKTKADLSNYLLKKKYCLKDVTKVSVYGDFRDNLSVTAKELVPYDQAHDKTKQ